MKQVNYICDICKKGNCIHHDFELQVIFITEQNEGRNSKPYLETVKIDLCEECISKILNGQSVFASGAMGYNKYYFAKPK